MIVFVLNALCTFATRIPLNVYASEFEPVRPLTKIECNDFFYSVFLHWLLLLLSISIFFFRIIHDVNVLLVHERRETAVHTHMCSPTIY